MIEKSIKNKVISTQKMEGLGYCEHKVTDDLCSPFDRSKGIVKPTVLLHSCCGPCSTSVIERLAHDYEIIVYFYNPNIDDPKEYENRKKTQKEFIDKYNKDNKLDISFVEGDYKPDYFHKISEGFEDEPEGGMRCPRCFELRLRSTAHKALEMGIKIFATTLTVSPHKNYRIISAIGQNIAAENNLQFLDIDFKKKAGFQKSIEISKEYNLYRQNYCGCNYARRIQNSKKQESPEEEKGREIDNEQ